MLIWSLVSFAILKVLLAVDFADVLVVAVIGIGLRDVDFTVVADIPCSEPVGPAVPAPEWAGAFDAVAPSATISADEGTEVQSLGELSVAVA